MNLNIHVDVVLYIVSIFVMHKDLNLKKRGKNGGRNANNGGVSQSSLLSQKSPLSYNDINNQFISPHLSQLNAQRNNYNMEELKNQFRFPSQYYPMKPYDGSPISFNKQQAVNPNSMTHTKKRPLSPMPPIELISSKNRQRSYDSYSANNNNVKSISGENNTDITHVPTLRPLKANNSRSQPDDRTSNRSSKREKILNIKPWPEVIYDMKYINTRYNTTVINSKHANESWLKSPKNFLNNLIKTPINWESFGPDDNKLHRATLTLEIGGSIIIAHGDATTKKDAEKISYLDACYLIESKSLIDAVQKYSSTIKQQQSSSQLQFGNGVTLEIDPKKYVIEYCAKFDHVPIYKLASIGPDHNKLWEAIVELPKNITGRGRATTKKEAELKAAEDFKNKAEKHQALQGKTSSISEKNNMSEDIAKDFIKFYCKYFKYENPEFNYKGIGPGHSMMWEASLIVEDHIIGTGQRSNKRDAQASAYLDAAIALRKDSPDLWKNFENDKSKSKEATSPKPAPFISVQMSNQTCKALNNLVSELQQADTFQRNDEDIIMDKREKMEKNSLDQIYNKKGNMNQELLTNNFLNAKSDRLFETYQNYLNSPDTEQLRFNRSQLPISSYANTILDAIESNPVTVVVGSTGCGKTTQLPQLIFEKEIIKRQGARCNIIVTQPRRIAAISVAQRVAYERSEKLGSSVGYQVRFESIMPASAGSILYCTTGVFLRRMHEEKNGKDVLEGVTHIVVDEVHERDMNADFLLVILKRILHERRRNERPPIKLILMSATIDTGIFAEYFGDFFTNGRCPVVRVPGKIYPVQQYFIEDFVKKLRNLYAHQLDNKDTLKYIDREMKILQPKKSPPTRFVSPKSTIQGKYLAMDIDSDEIDSHSSEIDDNDNSSIGSSSTGTVLKQNDEQIDAEIPYHLISLVIAHIINTTEEGAILVFLPGWEEIMALNRLLTTTPNPLGINFSDQLLFRIHMLHSSLPSLSQQEVFEPLPNPNLRKIILATNIAETSITIQDVVHVVDSGKVKEKRYDPSKRMTNLVTTWISQSNSRQRSGRAGRVREGEYYVMMSRARYQNLEGYSTPEMLRSDLQEICLHIKALDLPTTIGDVLAQAIQPPDHASVSAALENLRSLQALDSTEELTPLGKVLATLPMEPGLGKMVLLGAIFQCLDPILTIAACISSKSPFLSPPQAKERADEVKVHWAQGLFSDHFAILNAYKAWYELHSSGNFREVNKFCTDNFLNRTSLQTIEQVKIQLLNLLERAGVVPKHYPQKDYGPRGLALGPPEYNVNSNCLPLLRSLICAGVYPNISLKTSKKTYRTRHENITFIHPASVNYKGRAAKLARSYRADCGIIGSESDGSLFAPIGTLYAYSTKIKTSGQQVYLRSTTRIDPLSVILFGGEIKLRQQNNCLLLTIDEWLQFGGNDKVIKLANKLKYFLENCLAQVYERLDTNVNNNNNNSTLTQNDKLNLAGKLNENNEKIKDKLVRGIVEILDRLDNDL
ncbi:P-loop containing nucleoside triphosphate hydrolase protein [Glomus cerebriforme]|uniref:P-loop containing nucleoside triphosphate hydrolase protein n=1 Tax=Glomus cerebriforme TaxID=658196 RepID=A0A397T2E1_9GLOM|nr:P-loop containing nucleoside triphosphate hydrolase protein [Glomus cerebriforme]